VVFVPLAFLGGVTGAFFRALSFTMASGLVISFFVTWLAVPLLADRLLTKKDADQEEGGRASDWLHRHYETLMRLLLARPALVLIGVVPLLAVGSLAYHRVGSGFMPAMDEGGFILDYRAPPGTSVSETDRLARQEEGGRASDWLHRHYETLMRLLLARPALVLIGVVPLLAVGSLAYHRVGSGFMPAMDEGGFILDYRAPPGTSVSETDRLARQVE